MKTLATLLLAAALAAATPPSAAQQKKRTPPKATPQPAAQQARQAMDAYDFTRAAQLLDAAIATQQRKRKPTEDITLLEDLRDQALRMEAMLHATEHIVFIDSLVCTTEQALKAITLTRESGRLDTYASTYHTTDPHGITIYENELANKRYLAVAPQTPPQAQNPKATLRLAVADKLGTQWSQPQPLTGLNTDDTAQNFPFLLSDGITLYYAAQGPESLGGYDIFVTRADGDDGTFLTPENIGFPFNSPADDYLLAIDELSQLGWFVTARRQPKGHVCVYTFIPNATRQTLPANLTPDALRRLARLTSWKDTWHPAAAPGTPAAAQMPPEVAAARQRLQDLRAGKTPAHGADHDFTFHIDDTRTCHRLDDFRSPQARELMQQYLQLAKTTQTDATMLRRLRDTYAKAAPGQRTQLAKSILQLEATHYPALRQLRQLEKQVRNAEITQP